MNRSDQDRNAYMLCGPLARKGYLRWWHSFVGIHAATGKRRTFFLEYLILNPVPQKKINAKLSRPSYVRVSAGAFPTDTDAGINLCAYYPVSACKYAAKPLYFQVGENFLSENRLTGFVDVTEKESEQDLLPSDVGTMEWDLEVHKTLACHTGIIASPLFCALNALDSFWHGEGIRTEYRGIIDCNGESYEVLPETCFGYADKHWGSAYNSPWLLLSSCRLYSERTGKLLKHSAFALDGCVPRFLFFRFRPTLLLQLTYTGEDFCYSFARPFRRTRIKWSTKESRTKVAWQVKAQNKDSLLKLKLFCPKSNLMRMHYDDPTAVIGKSSVHNLRAGRNARGTIDLYRLTPEGKEWIDTLTIQDALCEYQKSRKKENGKNDLSC